MQPNNPSSNQAPFTPPQQTIDFDKPQEKSPDQGRTQMVQQIYKFAINNIERTSYVHLVAKRRMLE